jgi:hypothetical protein
MEEPEIMPRAPASPQGGGGRPYNRRSASSADSRRRLNSHVPHQSGGPHQIVLQLLRSTVDSVNWRLPYAVRRGTRVFLMVAVAHLGDLLLQDFNIGDHDGFAKRLAEICVFDAQAPTARRFCFDQFADHATARSLWRRRRPSAGRFPSCCHDLSLDPNHPLRVATPELASDGSARIDGTGTPLPGPAPFVAFVGLGVGLVAPGALAWDSRMPAVETQ